MVVHANKQKAVLLFDVVQREKMLNMHNLLDSPQF